MLISYNRLMEDDYGNETTELTIGLVIDWYGNKSVIKIPTRIGYSCEHVYKIDFINEYHYTENIFKLLYF
jgi:hypothetical protein